MRPTDIRPTIILPWPPPALSPNRRQHWSRLSKAKARYRLACKLVASTYARDWALIPDGPLSLTVTFHPPDKREYDRDNLLARIKAGIDGMCDALAFDDSRFAVTTVRVGEPFKGGYVALEIRGTA